MDDTRTVLAAPNREILLRCAQAEVGSHGRFIAYAMDCYCGCRGSITHVAHVGLVELYEGGVVVHAVTELYVPGKLGQWYSDCMLNLEMNPGGDFVSGAISLFGEMHTDNENFHNRPEAIIS